MVDEIQRAIDSESEKIGRIITDMLSIFMQQEKDPLKRKLINDLIKIPNDDRVTIFIPIGLEEKVENFAMQNKLPYCPIIRGESRNQQSLAIISAADASKFYNFMEKLKQNDPRYYRDSDTELFAQNLAEIGDHEAVKMHFNTESEAFRFRDKLFQGGMGSTISITRDVDGKGFVGIMKSADLIHYNNSKMDLIRACVEESLNHANKKKSVLQEAAALWNEKEESDFVKEVIKSGKDTNLPVYLIDVKNPENRLIYTPDKGIVLKNKAETKVLVRADGINEVLDLHNADQLIKMAASTGFDEIHNMKAYSAEEYKNSYLKDPKRYVRAEEDVLKAITKRHKDGREISAKDLLVICKAYPAVNWDGLADYGEKMLGENGNECSLPEMIKKEVYNRRLRNELLGKKGNTGLIYTWMKTYYPNISEMSAGECISAVKECLKSKEIKSVLNSAQKESEGFVDDFTSELSKRFEQFKAESIRKCVKDARDGDALMETERMEKESRTVERTEQTIVPKVDPEKMRNEE